MATLIRATEIILVDYRAQRAVLGRRLVEPFKNQLIGFGGKVEEGETHIACAIRETFEEACVRVARSHMKHIGVLITDSFLVQVYVATRWTGVPTKTATMEPVWVSLLAPYPDALPPEMVHLMEVVARKRRGMRMVVRAHTAAVTVSFPYQ